MNLGKHLSSRDNTAYVTYGALTVSMRDGDDGLLLVKQVRVSAEGEPHRENWNHFIRSMGALMWESAVEAGFDEPLTPSAIGTPEFFNKIAAFLEANADKSYVLHFDNLQLHYTALEEQMDAGKRIADAQVDAGAAVGKMMWGPFYEAMGGTAIEEVLRSANEASHTTIKHRIELPLSDEIDLGTAAKHMAEWVSIVQNATSFGVPGS